MVNNLDNNRYVGLFMLLSVPMMLQTFFFAIIMIQQTQSFWFRIFIGFVGIGMAIVPILLRKSIGAAPNKGRKIFRFDLKPNTQLAVDIIALMALTAAPWISIIQNHASFKIQSITFLTTPGSAMVLCSSIFSFAVAGFIYGWRHRNNDPIWLSIFRIIICIGLIAAAFKMYYPTLLYAIAWGYHQLGVVSPDFVYAAIKQPFWNLIVSSISNIFVWQISFIICLLIQIGFYKRWLVDQE